VIVISQWYVKVEEDNSECKEVEIVFVWTKSGEVKFPDVFVVESFGD
jgi:hypothetical protein